MNFVFTMSDFKFKYLMGLYTSSFKMRLKPFNYESIKSMRNAKTFFRIMQSIVIEFLICECQNALMPRGQNIQILKV